MHAITVTVNGQPPAVVSTGTRISDLLPSVNGDGFPVLGAIVNNMVLPLFMPLVADAAVAPLTIQNPYGRDIYRTSLCFLLAKSVHELYPGIECRVRNSVGAGLGFMLAMVMFAGVRERMESCDIPKFMQGLPITLVAASLVSVSFLGFTGIVETIFG